MGERIQFPEWRKENDATRYPFAADATLTNGTQFLLDGTFLDASLYPIGGGPRLYLSKAEITHDTATLFIGNDANQELASASFSVIAPPDSLIFVDVLGRPAGLIVSESRRLSIFISWGVGTHVFDQDATAFAATVCVPTPEIGIRGIALEDGSILTGDVWLVGSDGVVLRQETVTAPAENACGQDIIYQVIRIDIVGDPLFRRRLCKPTSLFETPLYVKTVTFKDGKQTRICGPNKFGDVKMTVNNDFAEDTVLRIHPTPDGNVVEVVGSQPKNGV